MKLIEIDAPDFDLAMTLGSGQVFHWEKAGAGFVGTIGEAAVFAEQRGEVLLVAGTRARVAAKYFALDHHLPEICRAFPNDAAMNAASDF